MARRKKVEAPKLGEIIEREAQIARCIEEIPLMLAAVRRRRGWNTSDLARRSGLSQKGIYMMEVEGRSSRLDTLARLAYGLGVIVVISPSGQSYVLEPADKEPVQ